VKDPVYTSRARATSFLGFTQRFFWQMIPSFHVFAKNSKTATRRKAEIFTQCSNPPKLMVCQILGRHVTRLRFYGEKSKIEF